MTKINGKTRTHIIYGSYNLKILLKIRNSIILTNHIPRLPHFPAPQRNGGKVGVRVCEARANAWCLLFTLVFHSYETGWFTQMADIELGITNETVSDDEEESEALTAAEVLQKLEEVSRRSLRLSLSVTVTAPPPRVTHSVTVTEKVSHRCVNFFLMS